MREGPGFFTHLALLWRMRMDSAFNGVGKKKIHPFLVYIPTLIPGIVLSIGAYSLFCRPAVASDAIVQRFLLGLICFVAAMVWLTWPVLSAGVDDHSEVSRYTSFPISRMRLIIASTLSGLLDPIAFAVYGPVFGAAFGYAHVRELQPWLVAAFFVPFVLMCAVWSRVGLHLVLGVLRSYRSAEALGGFVVFVILTGLILPPVDTSWMYEEGGGFEAIEADVFANAAIAFGRIPPGYFAEGLRHLSEGREPLAFLELFGMLVFTVIGLFLAAATAEGFGTSSGTLSSTRRNREKNPFISLSRQFSVLVFREALDLWRNPRARLLAGVPFILAVLLRLLSGRDLFEHLFGVWADIWLMGGMATYASILLLSSFTQNAFAYDGHGLRLLLASPVSAGLVLKAKNFVHGMAALILGLAVCLFIAVYLGGGGLTPVLITGICLFTLIPAGLASGNFLSILFPVKFHTSLQRRDRSPPASAILGLGFLGAGAAVLPLSIAVSNPASGPGIPAIVMALLCAAVSWSIYFFSLRYALPFLSERREKVLLAITRV